MCVCEREREREINTDIDQNTEKKPASPKEILTYSRASIYIPKTKIKACMGPVEFLRAWLLFLDVQTIYLELQVAQL